MEKSISPCLKEPVLKYFKMLGRGQWERKRGLELRWYRGAMIR